MTPAQQAEGAVLLQCPFDDGTKKHQVRADRRQGRAGTACPSQWYRERIVCKCGASGPEFKRPGLAGPAWNRRASAPSPPIQGEGLGSLHSQGCALPFRPGPMPTSWRSMETVPKDRTPILLLSPKGFTGIGFLYWSGSDAAPWLSGSVAWIGKTPGDTEPSVWMGGERAADAVGWVPLSAPSIQGEG